MSVILDEKDVEIQRLTQNHYDMTNQLLGC